MSESKIKFKLSINQKAIPSKEPKQIPVNLLQNKMSNIKLGFSGTKRNCAALKVQGNKFCKSCSEK